MTLEDIKNLNVPSDKNSALYLWTTAPKLLEGLDVMESWGFTYKSQAIWDKEIFGMGYWFRGQHEILLVGTKGKFSPPDSKNRVPSVFRYRRSKHSKKPPEIRDYLTKTFPNYDKLEMFARTRIEGWDFWGDQIDNSIKF
jgi:N6-adenosine-specific RNA methylase IME4